MTWIRDLHDKAGKAWEREGFHDWFDAEHFQDFEPSDMHPTDAEFIAACSPERVRALCELAEALEPSLFMAPAEVVEAWDRLASLEPARKEKT